MTHEFCSIFIRNTVKQGRSLTHAVSPDKIQHIQRLLRGRKHFLPSDLVSVAVSKLAETDHEFVQSDAKINSVYYCENVLEQGLLPAIRHISNDFVVQQDRAPAHRSHHNVT